MTSYVFQIDNSFLCSYQCFLGQSFYNTLILRHLRFLMTFIISSKNECLWSDLGDCPKNLCVQARESGNSGWRIFGVSPESVSDLSVAQVGGFRGGFLYRQIYIDRDSSKDTSRKTLTRSTAPERVSGQQGPHNLEPGLFRCSRVRSAHCENRSPFHRKGSKPGNRWDIL